MIPFLLGGASLLFPVAGAGIGAYYARSRGLPAWDGFLLGLSGPVGWLLLGLLGAETSDGWGGVIEEGAAEWREGAGPSARLERWARRLYRPTLAAAGTAFVAGLGILAMARSGDWRPWLVAACGIAGVLAALGTFLLWGLGVSLLVSDTRLPLRKRVRWATAMMWLNAPAALAFHPWRRRALGLAGRGEAAALPASAAPPATLPDDRSTTL